MKKIIEIEDQTRCPYYKDTGWYYKCMHPNNWNQSCEIHGGKCPLPTVEDPPKYDRNAAIQRAIDAIPTPQDLFALRMGYYSSTTDPVTGWIFTSKEIHAYLIEHPDKCPLEEGGE